MAANKKANFILEFKEEGIEIIEKTMKELEKLGITATQVSESVSEATDEIKDMADETENAGEEAAKTQSKWKKAFNYLANGAKNTKGVISGIAADFKKIGLVSAASIGVGITATGLYANKVLNDLDQVAINANKAGVSLQKFSAMAQVAARTGNNIEQLSDKLIQLNEFVSEAAEWGSGSGFEVLTTLNLDAKELAKLDPATQLERIFSAMQGLDISYQKQLLSALSLDDLIPFLGNLGKVQPLLDKINRTGLNIDSTDVLKVKDTLHDMTVDLSNFSTIVLVELYKNLDEIYNLSPSSESILNGSNAKEIASSLAGTIDALVILGQALGVVGDAAVFTFKAIMAVPVGIEKGAKALGNMLGDKLNESKIARLKVIVDEGTNPMATEKSYNQMLKNFDNQEGTNLAKFFSFDDKFLQKDFDKMVGDFRKLLDKNVEESNSDISDSLNDTITSLNLKVDALKERLSGKKDIWEVELKPVGVGFEEDKKVTLTDEQKKAATELMRVNNLKKEIAKIQNDIELKTIDIQINPDNESKLRKELDVMLKNLYSKMKDANTATRNGTPGFQIIDVKNTELAISESEKAMVDYYDRLEAKNKETFDKIKSSFDESLSNTNIEYDLGLIDFDTAEKELNSTFAGLEKFVKSNGDYNDVLTVQQAKVKAMKDLRDQEDAKLKDIIALEGLRIDLLTMEGKEVEALELKRLRAIDGIKKQVKDLNIQGQTIDITNKLFDFQKLKAIQSDLDKLDKTLQETSITNTEKILDLEGQIAGKKGEQIDLQTKLGVETEKQKEDVLFTVGELRKLNTVLGDNVVDAFSDMAAGIESADDAMKKLATNFLKSISRMIIEQLYFNAIASITGGSVSDARSGKIGLATSAASAAIPFFHDGLDGNGSGAGFMPRVQVPGLTNSNEGLAILKKGERVVTENQQYNQQFKNTNNTSNSNFYMDGEQLTSAVFNSNTAEESVLKIITKNKNTIKSL